MIEIQACSSNPGKLREFELAAAEFGSNRFRIVALPGLKDIAPPDENGDTFEANAGLKACAYSAYTQEIVLADDSGLEVDALNGAPGVYSARYATPHQAERALQDGANNRLLLENMHGRDDRRARFVCVIALAKQGQLLQTFKGTVEGELLTSERGSNGFGYDPLFYYPPFQCGFAEIEGQQKFSVSHRGNALRKAIAWLLQIETGAA